MINAQIIADSLSPEGVRLTTFELEYHRYIHAEVLTHRMFCRNAASSRAIPTRNLIRRVMRSPMVPIHWGLNETGMQAHSEAQGWRLGIMRGTWRAASVLAAGAAWIMSKAGAHKQIVNRVLEPFLPIRVVMTGTEWANFLALRDHPDAQPEIRELARQIRAAMLASTPRHLLYSEWHLPYVSDAERQCLADPIKVSVARCARVSYRLHDGTPTNPQKDISLYNRLVSSHPLHASPAEHQATPSLSHRGPLRGWTRHRDFLAGENVKTPNHYMMEDF